MSAPDQDAAALLQSLGLKLTRPRMRLVTLILDRTDDQHAMSAGDLYLALGEDAHGISPGTVYRTLGLLESRGVIERRMQPDGRHAYARPASQPLHHMRVADSGEIIRFSDEALEARLAALARASGFRYLKSELLVHVCSEAAQR